MKNKVYVERYAKRLLSGDKSAVAVYLLGVVVFLGISTTSGYVVGAEFGRNNE